MSILREPSPGASDDVDDPELWAVCGGHQLAGLTPLHVTLLQPGVPPAELPQEQNRTVKIVHDTLMHTEGLLGKTPNYRRDPVPSNQVLPPRLHSMAGKKGISTGGRHSDTADAARSALDRLSKLCGKRDGSDLPMAQQLMCVFETISGGADLGVAAPDINGDGAPLLLALKYGGPLLLLTLVVLGLDPDQPRDCDGSLPLEIAITGPCRSEVQARVLVTLAGVTVSTHDTAGPRPHLGSQVRGGAHRFDKAVTCRA